MNEINLLISTKTGLYKKKAHKKYLNIKKSFLNVKVKSKRSCYIAIVLFIIILVIGFSFFLNKKIKKKELNKNKSIPLFISNFKKEYKPPDNQNPVCKDLDPINSFNLRLKSPAKIICKNGKSQHICYLNKLSNYAGPKGVICKMNNIVLDPTHWHNGSYTYKGPVDKEKKGKPILSKGFFNMNCQNESLFHDYGKMYESYFNGWNYHSEDKNTYEELAPGKTVFFLSRNQDSPNLYHGGSEFINALSLMYLFDLEPENIIIFFLESMTIEDDPFYDLYSNLIGRGGKPIYPKNLNMTKKYFISNAIHIPINWDSPCFILSGVPSCQNPTLTYYFLNKLVDKYMNIIDYKDLFQSDGDIYYYPKSVQNYSSSINFTKTITFQWRRVWPKGRKNQYRILGNGPELADKLAAALPSNILLRLIDTASLPMAEQISIMKKTDYFVGMHGAGLTLSIFSPNHCIFHEVLHQHNMNGLLLFASLSGHKTYSDSIESTKKIVDTNELIFFNEDQFVNKVLSHMKENNLI